MQNKIFQKKVWTLICNNILSQLHNQSDKLDTPNLHASVVYLNTKYMESTNDIICHTQLLHLLKYTRNYFNESLIIKI